MNQLKTVYPATPFVLLDAGNYSDNPTEAGDARTAALLAQMAKLGTRVVNVGDRDLTLGYDEFAKRTHGLPMEFVSTNIVKQGTKTPAFAPYALVDVKGASGKPVRIGVLGIIRYSPVWQKAGPNGENLAVASPAEMIKLYLPEVRKKSDVVVLLASISKEDAHDLAKELTDLDLVVGAYGGIYNTVEENEGRVRIVYVGNQGKRIGESRVAFDAKRRVADLVTYMHFLTARYPEDKAMADVVAEVNAKLAKPPEGAAPAEPVKPQPVAPAGGH